MSRRSWSRSAYVALLVIAVSGHPLAQSPPASYDIGRAASDDEIAGWGVNVDPDGEGLPAGGATAADGRRVYLQRCARCHGPTGTEGPDDRLVGRPPDLVGSSPSKTVGSYWSHATTLWDYVHRAMPFDQPGSLTVDEVYGAVAYVLFLNEIIGEHERVDASSLARVPMPNRDGFVEDPRPDVEHQSTR